MSTVESNESTATDNERRALARDKARQLRDNQRKRDRRNRVLLRGGIGIGILVALAVVAVVLVTSIRPPQPGPANMGSDGILIAKGLKAVTTPAVAGDGKPVANPPSTDGTVDIVEYTDYLCPYCGDFERTNDDQIGELVKSGAATVEIHPLATLTNSSAGSKYSLRAANAAGCVAQYSPDAFWAFNQQMFREQPDEGTRGLSDARIRTIAKDAGAKKLSDIARCIDTQRFAPWVQDALTRAEKGPIPNTTDVKHLVGLPLILVDGKQYTGALTNADDFRAFIVQAQGTSYASQAPTAAPTPTEAPKGATVGTTTSPTP